VDSATPDTLEDRVRRGDHRAIARAITLVEDETPEGVALLGRLHRGTGRAFLIGVTGPPGAGKSTLVDALVAHVRPLGVTVGIIAVDPTSPFTGGAILGDRVRMGRHAGDEGVFIRSMATRGHLGGLARATSNVAAVLDAAGSDLVFIETVGVGQGEVDIVRAADVSVVVLVPGAGDDVQALKAGIMEIADLFVVNKSDREGADRLARSIAASLSLRPFGADEWRPPVIRTQATTGEGVAEVWSAVERFRAHAAARQAERRRARTAAQLRDRLSELLLREVDRALPGDEYARMVDRIVAGAIDPHAAAAALLERVIGPAGRDRRPRGVTPS
jgi:LAO/AO transport system kinase